MVDLPTELVLCAGSGLPTDIVDDVASHQRSYMCGTCGASMTDRPLATSHRSRLD